MLFVSLQLVKKSEYSAFVLIVKNNLENNQAQYDLQLGEHLNT